jgi:hypothetical protein
MLPQEGCPGLAGFRLSIERAQGGDSFGRAFLGQDPVRVLARVLVQKLQRPSGVTRVKRGDSGSHQTRLGFQDGARSGYGGDPDACGCAALIARRRRLPS